MIAPVPYFEPRGADFQVYDRLRALSQLGHQVDLVTYPVGEDVTFPGLRLRRTWGWPGLKRVKVGPSLAKFPLDALLFLRALPLLMTHHYDVIHTHLEAGYFGAILGKLFRLPHVYDMHDDLSEQLTNSKFTKSRLLIRMMQGVERTILRSASQVIYVYPELRQTIERFAPGRPDTSTTLIYNSAVGGDLSGVEGKVLAKRLATLRRDLNIAEGAGPVIVYTGTFEPYQGLDLLVASMPAALARYPQAVYVLVGGLPDQVAQVRGWAQAAGVEHAIRLPGRRPMEEMPLCMRLADVLVSPRSEGTNTPLKLFSYLAAGKPIVATAIHSNTQVLTPEVALLIPPTGEALAQGTLQLLDTPSLGDTLSANGQALAERMYSYDALVRGVALVYARVMAPATPTRDRISTPTPATISSEAQATLMVNTAARPDTLHETTTRPEPRPAYRRERIGALDLSIVVPVYNEEENIPHMHRQLKDALDELKLSYEIFYIDDGSRDASFARLSHIADSDPTVTIIRFRRNFGQTAAMSAGISHSQGDIIVLMDADMQNDPNDIRLLLEKLDEGYDCVSGWRAKRRDPFLSRKLPSRIANGIISKVTGVKLHDYGCTLKAYRREVLEHVRLYGEMHRFIPVYASWSGARIAEVPVNHRARQFGKSKYGISRTIRVVLDLLTVKFLGSYSTKPLYAFGYVGFILGALAMLSEVVAVAERILPPYVRIHANPLMILGAILFVLGIQTVMMGLLAELIMRTYYESQSKPTYIVHSVVVGSANGAMTLPRRGAASNPLAVNPFALLVPGLFGAAGQTDANGAISGAFAQPLPFAAAPTTPATGVRMTPLPFPTLPEMTPEDYRRAQVAAAQFAYQGMLAGMIPGVPPMAPGVATGPQNTPETRAEDADTTPTPAAPGSAQMPLGV